MLIVSACLLLALVTACIVSSVNGGYGSFAVVINEVVSSNSGSLTDDAIGSPDWIELYNRGGRDIALEGYRLANKARAGQCVFGEVTVPAGGYLKIYALKNGDAAAGACLMNFNISKGGEELYFISPDGVTLQTLHVPGLLTDESYARRDDGTYGYCAAPTPGAGNVESEILDAPARDIRPASNALILNEALPRPAGGSAWAELCNTGSTALNLADYCLTDNLENPDKWRLPQKNLAPGEYAVIEFSETDDGGATLHAPFKLGSRDTALYLHDVAGNALGSLKWPARIPEGLSAVAGGAYTAEPTKGKANSSKTFPSGLPAAMDGSDTVRIEEVLARNTYGLADGEGERSEWVELYNRGTTAVSLSGWYLSDDRDELFKWAFPDMTVEAGGYRVVFLSGKQGTADELHASFRLSAGETGVYLTSADFRVDSFALPDAAEDVSVGRDKSGGALYFRRPTPSAANGAGVTDASLLGCYDKNGMYISEVCAANAAKSGKNDWIELFNGSQQPIDMSGYYLSDDADEKLKWRIPRLTVPTGGYAVIETTSNIERQNANTATFGISPLGETLFLSDRDGNTLDVFETGTLRAGVTSGRVEGNDKLARVYFGTPTRGRQNAAESSEGYAAKPLFSQAGLYQDAEFQLTITCPTPDAKIFYTTDGTPPTAASTAYTGPVSIKKNTPVRAVAYAGGLLPSDVATVTYLFETPHTVPVFCITGKPREMKTVIESDLQRTKPEFPAYVEYYEIDGTLGVSFPSSVRPKGRASLRMPQNSLALSLGGNYGQPSVTYPFFSGSELSTYSSLALRTSGQDTPAARMRDTYFQRVERNLNVDSIQTKFVVVYVNGQYNGLFDLNEEQDTDYFASCYGVDADSIEIINSNAIVVAGENKEYKRIYKIAEEWNMKDDAVFAEFAKLVDTDACIDYLCAQTYFGNGDLVNVRFWRTKDYSIRWRPILFDLDFSLRFNDRDRNVFDRYLIPEPTISGGSVIVEMHIFGALMQNKAWRGRFVERFVELAYTEFSPQRILKMFDDIKAEMQPEMAKTIEKWRMPSSMKYWEEQTLKLREALEARQAIALKQMQRYFRVPEEKMRELTEKYSKASV